MSVKTTAMRLEEALRQDGYLTPEQERGWRMSPELGELVNAARAVLETTGGVAKPGDPTFAALEALAKALEPFAGVNYTAPAAAK